jgi:hypothetical protein
MDVNCGGCGADGAGGYWGSRGGSAGQAILAGEPLVADCERVLGPDHPDTLTSRNNLAAAYETAGQAAEAIPLHQQTLAARERLPQAVGSARSFWFPFPWLRAEFRAACRLMPGQRHA